MISVYWIISLRRFSTALLLNMGLVDLVSRNLFCRSKLSCLRVYLAKINECLSFNSTLIRGKMSTKPKVPVLVIVALVPCKVNL